jgi:hypothetical protein
MNKRQLHPKLTINTLVHLTNKYLKWIIVVCVIFIAGDIFVIFHNGNASPTFSPTTDTSDQPEVEAKKEQMQTVVQSVQKYIGLPQNEEPMMATVTDKNNLQEQDFFKQAQNGDKILLYRKAKKAFLYRPSTDKVIAEAPLMYKNSSTIEASSAAQVSPIVQLSTSP